MARRKTQVKGTAVFDFGCMAHSWQGRKNEVFSFVSRFRKSSFVKNFFTVMFGTAIAQVIGFALAPIISRLFSPSEFGVFGSFVSVSTVIAAGVTLEYTQAIMLPGEKTDAINLFAISCLSTCVISLCCLTACLVAPGWLQSLVKLPNAWFLALLVVATVVNGINQSCQAWCVRVKAFRHTSSSQVIRSMSASGTQIGLGSLKWGSSALICGGILADLLASVNLAQVALCDLKALRGEIRWSRMKRLASDYRDFPAYATSQNVINAISRNMPVLLLAHFYGIAIAGAYAFGVRILQVPMEFVSRALRQVLFQKASETHQSGGSLMPIYIKITLGLFALSVAPALVMVIWAPQIFAWTFGAQWYTAGVFAQGLVLWLTFAFCNLPSLLFARIIRIQRTFLCFDLVLLAVRALTLILGGLYFSASHTIMLFSAVGAAMNVILILIVGYALAQKEGTLRGKGVRQEMWFGIGSKRGNCF